MQPTADENAQAREWAEGRAKTFAAAQERELTRTSGVYFSGMGREIVTYDEAWIEAETKSLAAMIAGWRVKRDEAA